MDFFIAGLNTENCGVLAIHEGEKLRVKRDSHARSDSQARSGSHARNGSQARKTITMKREVPNV